MHQFQEENEDVISRLSQLGVSLKKENEEIRARIELLEAKQSAFEDGFKYYTVLDFAVIKGYPSLTITEAAKLEKQARDMAEGLSSPIDRIKDPRFGPMNAYHEGVLDAVFSSALNGEI